VYGRNTETYTEYAGGNLLEALLKALDRAAAAELEIKETEWALLTLDLEKQAAEWEARMSEIVNIARSEWIKAFGAVNTGYNTWRRNYVDRYAEKSAE
jgi:hypothetical protein